MIKHIGNFFHKTIRITIGLLLVLCLLFAAMQTKGFKKLVQEKLVGFAQSSGIQLSIGQVEGTPPFQWILKNVHLEISSQNTLDIEKAHMRLAIFPLFRKEIAISYLSFQKAELRYLNEHTPLPSFDLPWAFSLRSLRAENIEIIESATGKTGTFSCRGRGKLKKHFSGFLTDFKLSSTPYSNSFISVMSHLNKGELDTLIQVQAQSPIAFTPLYTLPHQSEGSCESHLSGNWETWKALFQNRTTSTNPLKGNITAKIDRVELPHFKIANRKWEVSSLFNITPGKEIGVESLELFSNLFTFTSWGTLSPHLDIKKLQAHFTFPKLSLLSIYLPLTLKGKLSGILDISENSALFELTGDNFGIGEQDYSQFSSLFKAKKEKEDWQGRVEFYGVSTWMPLTGYCDFNFKPHEVLDLKDFLFTAPETKIAGQLALHLQPLEMYGNLFGQILSLKPYRHWAPRHSEIEGSVGGNITFLGDHLASHFLIRNFHYFNTYSDELLLSCSLLNFFKRPQFSLSLEGKNFVCSPFYFSHYNLKTDWNGTQGPYYLTAKGEWKDLLEIEANGTWTQNSLSFDHLQGTLFKETFSLQHPFSVTRATDTLTLTPCHLQIGQGELHSALELNPQFSQGYLKATHFPLELLLISYPNLSLGGKTLIEAKLIGNEDHLQGSLDLTLEEVALLQSHPLPLHAKGTFHAELNDKTLDLKSHLVASEGQLFKASASLPIEYSLFPFKAWVSPRRALSGEVVLDGKIEEIFDFLNMGSHRFAGRVSSELTLSHHLESPHLKGKLDLRDGSYENYFTGTHLKNITAHLDALGNQIALTQFEAQDEQEGKTSATGTLNLNPNQSFPYQALAELDNLNFLQFDAVSANFSGPLTIKGDLQSATASGSLTITQAELSIPDTLPPEIPVLPVKFINKPPHLNTSSMHTTPIFPFHLQLDLNAPGSIIVRGRGLRSEWQGNALLTGTNANITAAGNLNLVRGEFQFSGKTFNLTQGEITFTDQTNHQGFINLKGELSITDLTITALLTGPLNAPALTFQSSPHMPTSSILSYILFNKDISSVTPLQALQIARTILTLSGSAGPDVLEKIRKTIGVDRLNIISSSQNPDQMALQIGKYLTKGVMVTLSQGFNSSQIVVEVELKYGFLLQAETQDVEEAKFSLKWNRNY